MNAVSSRPTDELGAKKIRQFAYGGIYGVSDVSELAPPSFRVCMICAGDKAAKLSR